MMIIWNKVLFKLTAFWSDISLIDLDKEFSKHVN